jgi:hypothetical protein
MDETIGLMKSFAMTATRTELTIVPKIHCAFAERIMNNSAEWQLLACLPWQQ